MAATFLFSLTGGMLAIIATAKLEQISPKYLRVISLIVLALVCAEGTWLVRESSFRSAGLWAVAAVLGLVLFLIAVALTVLAPLVSRHRRAFRVLCAVGGLVGLSAGCVAALASLGESSLGLPAAIMVVVGRTLGGLVLGSITVAWLLGHAYLTATKMTIAPLKHFSRMLNWAVGMRVAFFVLSVLIGMMAGQSGGGSLIAQLSNAWLVVSLRVGMGLVALSVFAYMVWDCVRLRSTQSATGILYFGSLFAYVGELASHQLIYDCGWPI